MPQSNMRMLQMLAAQKSQKRHQEYEKAVKQQEYESKMAAAPSMWSTGASGMALGASIGSMFGPGVGTAIGAGIGGVAGLIGGGFAEGSAKSDLAEEYGQDYDFMSDSLAPGRDDVTPILQGATTMMSAGAAAKRGPKDKLLEQMAAGSPATKASSLLAPMPTEPAYGAQRLPTGPMDAQQHLRPRR